MLMLSVISSIALGLSHPTVAIERGVDTSSAIFDKTVEVCRTDVQHYLLGDTTYLERGIKNFPLEKQQYMLDMCMMYATGVADGLAIKTYKEK